MDPLILIAVILIVLWAVGYTFVASSAVHLLLVIVLILVVVRLARGGTI